MIHRFKTTPVEVEAFQITKKTRMDSTDWPVWLEKAWNRDEGRVGAVFRQWHKNVEPDRLCLKAPEGVLLIDWNDWIIRGEDKQLYLCKPNIFETLYEPVKRKRNEE